MSTHTKDGELQEVWNRLVLLLIALACNGWEHELRETTCREIERFAAWEDERERDG